MPVGSSEDMLTASEKVSSSDPMSRSKVNDSNSGEVISSVNILTCNALEGGTGTTGDPPISCIVFAVRDRKVLTLEVASSVEALILSVSLCS